MHGYGVADLKRHQVLSDHERTRICLPCLRHQVIERRGRHGWARQKHEVREGRELWPRALENLARSLAMEYASTGIRVNVVSPGNVAAGSSLKVFEEHPAYREFVLRVSLGRRNSPDSIADAFVFLCSPMAAEINGQVLSPDHGGGIGNRL